MQMQNIWLFRVNFEVFALASFAGHYTESNALRVLHGQKPNLGLTLSGLTSGPDRFGASAASASCSTRNQGI
jgi:hypothetical protein